jgi:hypothetical protein
MRLPQWGPDLNQPTIQQTVDLSQKYGFIKDKPDLTDLIRPSGGT